MSPALSRDRDELLRATSCRTEWSFFAPAPVLIVAERLVTPVVNLLPKTDTEPTGFRAVIGRDDTAFVVSLTATPFEVEGVEVRA